MTPEADAIRFVEDMEPEPEMLEQLRVAAEALGRGDPGPFAALFAEGAEWRGVSRGHLWWKQTPS